MTMSQKLWTLGLFFTSLTAALAANLSGTGAAASLRDQTVALARQVQETEQRIQSTEDKLLALQQGVADHRAQLDWNHERTARLLSQLWHVSQHTQAQMFLHPDHLNGSVRSTLLFRHVLPHLRERANLVRNDLKTLTQYHHDANLELKHLKNDLTALQAQHRQLATLVEQETAEQHSLGPQATVLKRLWSVERPKTLGDILRLYQKHVASTASRTGHDRLQDTFLVKQPARGRILVTLPRHPTPSGRGQALMIKTRSRASVIAPLSGTVVYAQTLPGYGLTLVITNNNQRYVVLAGFAELSVRPGQELISGEPVGTMPAMTDDQPQLYVEVRQATHAEDATRWIPIWNGDAQNAS